MESGESSTGTEQKLPGPGSREGLEPPGLPFSASFILGTRPLTQHRSAPENQSPQYNGSHSRRRLQLLSCPRKSVGLAPRAREATPERVLEITQSIPILETMQ